MTSQLFSGDVGGRPGPFGKIESKIDEKSAADEWLNAAS